MGPDTLRHYEGGQILHSTTTATQQMIFFIFFSHHPPEHTAAERQPNRGRRFSFGNLSIYHPPHRDVTKGATDWLAETSAGRPRPWAEPVPPSEAAADEVEGGS